MTRPAHWQDPVNAVAGVAVLVSPWICGYALAQAAVANAVIVGTLLFVVAVGAAVIGRPWVECAVVALGTWLVASPWALGLQPDGAIHVAVGFGAVVLALGAWSLADVLRRRGGADLSAKVEPRA
jgi:hypothetical protein